VVENPWIARVGAVVKRGIVPGEPDSSCTQQGVADADSRVLDSPVHVAVLVVLEELTVERTES
jgi:hypothetical protein